MPASRCSVRIRSRICAWIVTSSAVAGDQQARIAGQRHRDHRPLPHPAREPVRCSWKRCSGAGIRTFSSIAKARRVASARPIGRCRIKPSMICSPIVKAGFSDDIGSWKIIAMPLPRRSLQLTIRRADQLLAIEADRAGVDSAGRTLDQAHDRERGHAFAAARLADDRQRAARGYRETYAVDRGELAVVGLEVRAQAAHLEQRRHVFLAARSA